MSFAAILDRKERDTFGHTRQKHQDAAPESRCPELAPLSGLGCRRELNLPWVMIRTVTRKQIRRPLAPPTDTGAPGCAAPFDEIGAHEFHGYDHVAISAIDGQLSEGLEQ